MPGFDALAPDQKAVLQLLLKQGKTYDDIAGLLRLDRTNVRERALDALDALGAETVSSEVVGSLSSEHQDEIADHLLLQQTASERAATREFLETSPAGRAWARGVASELRPIGGDALPEIPAEPAEVAEAFDALDQRTAAREREAQSSRLGGILILIAVGAVIGLSIVWYFGRDDSDSNASGDQAALVEDSGTAAADSGTTGGTGATGAAAAIPDQAINFKPPAGTTSKALGVSVIQQGALALQAEGLAASDLYDVWLYNSASDAVSLGFAFYDKTTKRLAGQVALPEEATKYKSIIVTKQTSEKPTKPGRIVLTGPIKQK